MFGSTILAALKPGNQVRNWEEIVNNWLKRLDEERA
jgi:hypothetical protein